MLLQPRDELSLIRRSARKRLHVGAFGGLSICFPPKPACERVRPLVNAITQADRNRSVKAANLPAHQFCVNPLGIAGQTYPHRGSWIPRGPELNISKLGETLLRRHRSIEQLTAAFPPWLG